MNIITESFAYVLLYDRDNNRDNNGESNRFSHLRVSSIERIFENNVEVERAKQF